MRSNPERAWIAESLLALPHLQPVDVIACEEVAMLLARIEAVDRDIEERGHFGRSGARVLLEHRARMSRELRAWLGTLGALPSARADWVAKLTRPSFAEAVKLRLESKREDNGHGTADVPGRSRRRSSS